MKLNGTKIINMKLNGTSMRNRKNKIFLLGQSYVEAINTAHIQNILNDNGMNVVIKYENDRSTSKVVEIDDFISKKTDLIVYGIAFKELGIQPCYDPVHQQALLDNAIENLPLNMDNTIQNIFANNPKQITIEILKKFLEKPEIIQIDNKSNLEYQKLSDDWRETTQKIRPISDLNKGGELLYPNLQIRAGAGDKYCFNSDAHNAKLDKFDKKDYQELIRLCKKNKIGSFLLNLKALFSKKNVSFPLFLNFPFAIAMTGISYNPSSLIAFLAIE